MKHVKHTRLRRPDFGFFHRCEWAILGTNCSDIQFLSTQLSRALTPAKVAYVDASHTSGSEADTSPFHTIYTQHKTYLELKIPPIAELVHDRIAYLESVDLVFINGNHFEGKSQILILDPEKESSLKKRLHRLTDVQMIIKKHPDYWPDFLSKSLSNSNPIPQLDWADFSSINSVFKQLYSAKIPPVYGLVLAGGRSTRMGFDKGKISIQGKDARIRLYEMLEAKTDKTFLSIRQDQKDELQGYPVLTDRFVGLGPFGAILTAFQAYPDAAWLVLATDLMGLSSSAIQLLIHERNPAAVATAFLNVETGFPDPLATIWEPKAQERLMSFLRQGYSCPRKVLINSDVHLLEPQSDKWLTNYNTPEDLSGLNL